MHQNGLRVSISSEDLCQHSCHEYSQIHPTGLLGILFQLNERIGMFQHEFFAYILDTKKAISPIAYVSIPIMEVFGLTNINL